ncbi:MULTISPECIES: hypothetical protein [Methylobacterium]|jgi:hypothetical protein|uniref:hypothetical protein n=1 Tax=Methylobacterium TaxID=407 RepID=UPI0011C9FAE5|nr:MULTISPECIES: hypothetical protein [Methylobacterium]TXN70201.1 hypothetical protein FV228_12275 [Methylobacterium sp. WL18]
MTRVEFRQEHRLDSSDETAQQRKARLAAEASMLAVAKADIADGRYIADGDVDAWLDAWVNGEPVELPEASAHSRKR